jgi:hypothetical protein
MSASNTWLDEVQRGLTAHSRGRLIQSAVLIPNADRATIDPAKLRDYLLSSAHPIGEELVEALRIQHLTQDGKPAGTTDRGQKYTIRAILSGPTGQSAPCRQRLVYPAWRRHTAVRNRVSGRWPVSFHALDVVVLNTDLPAQGLKRGDLGAVVDVYSPDAIEVEFVTASGRTQALITLRTNDIREIGDDDLVAVRRAETSPSRRDS